MSSQVLPNVDNGDDWPARQGKTGVASRVACRHNNVAPRTGGESGQEVDRVVDTQEDLGARAIV